MRSIAHLAAAAVALCHAVFAQSPPAGTLTLTLEDALARARTYSPQLYSAQIAARIAREDTRQAKAALLPTVAWNNQFIYTQPNGTPSGVFVSNDGPHVYNNQVTAHADIYAPGKRADYQRAIAAETVARARAEVAARGVVAVVVQNYYGLAASQRELENTRQSLKEAQQFLELTRKQESGGEVAHADVVKAQILAEQRQRDAGNAQLAVEKARLALGVLLFADYGQQFSVVDDLESTVAIPPFTEIQAMAARNNPEIRAAQATVQQQTHEITAARAAMLPSLSFDYFYGINANQFAIHNQEHQRNLGSAAQAQLTVPVWTWGAARSRVRQAELRLEQARNDLTLTQRQLLSNLNAFYLEADTAALQVASLKRSLDLASESLRLTLLRYEAGEVTALEVSDAQSTLAQARTAYSDGLVRRRVAVANLQTVTGAF